MSLAGIQHESSYSAQQPAPREGDSMPHEQKYGKEGETIYTHISPGYFNAKDPHTVIIQNMIQLLGPVNPKLQTFVQNTTSAEDEFRFGYRWPAPPERGSSEQAWELHIRTQESSRTIHGTHRKAVSHPSNPQTGGSK